MNDLEKVEKEQQASRKIHTESLRRAETEASWCRRTCVRQVRADGREISGP